MDYMSDMHGLLCFLDILSFQSNSEFTKLGVWKAGLGLTRCGVWEGWVPGHKVLVWWLERRDEDGALVAMCR